jgi:hypothetical protein
MTTSGGGFKPGYTPCGLRPAGWYAALFDQPIQLRFRYAHTAAHVQNGEPSNGDPIPNRLRADIQLIREFRHFEVPHYDAPLLHGTASEDARV